ncbi:sugar fermentation stimulation protein [Wenxinia marina DSM 24838]|uniref:Sugar fermentation stimulation protein homolog n=1 Tax=Wenxinia marina DSM 24838 TaxID=1123501 RepID=A0A0D0PHJ6_9RHOB|nr:sugar fermentation stimulation protein [Wenxinia marina DSM 24838]
MHFARPLVPATLLRRYKRFLADVALDDGTEVTVHCPNPGAMLGLDTPGARVWLEPTPGPTRKLPFGWRLVELPGGHFAGIDTGLPNRLVAEALVEGRIPALAGYRVHRPEVRYGQENSRVDFHLAGGAEPDAHVEVKNAHLRRTGDLCEFPDCVTLRGTKHLRELASVAQSGGPRRPLLRGPAHRLHAPVHRRRSRPGLCPRLRRGPRRGGRGDGTRDRDRPGRDPPDRPVAGRVTAPDARGAGISALFGLPVAQVFQDVPPWTTPRRT